MSLSDEYAALSQAHARQGDVRRAQLAAWLADVHALEDLLMENGLDLAPDPAAELAAVGDSVAASLEAVAQDLRPEARLDAREVAEIARRALVHAFDESVHDLLAARLPSLDHLSGLGARVVPTPPPRTPDPDRAQLLAVEAADCAAAAGALAAEGDADAAELLATRSDAAAFESYLRAAAATAGDEALATVELRWALVAGEQRTGDRRRQRLAAVVGAAERTALLRQLTGEAR
ncbi:hypothetical protein [Nocardioides sp. YIM 152315]|uniref:hypothetical protein n=1 Tax=Nocardioides sp. YIM 152315 TaxID=3031760 RepID=UPI0023DA0D40|nr:hypothetical protein [Nocardioides sp. YIM 152315]MDF1603485.1 hypothetical protein [Nocardioides sp. YIM 152315]